MRTASRLSAATLIAVVTSHAEKYTKYNFKGEVVPEPTTAETIAAYFPPENIVAILAAAMLPGMRKSVFFSFAGLALYGGWKFAICFFLGYYLLQFLIGGANSYE